MALEIHSLIQMCLSHRAHTLDWMVSNIYNLGVNPIPAADVTVVGNILPLSVLVIPTGTFNSVRCGPMSIKYEYTGRLDNCSGYVSAGIFDFMFRHQLHIQKHHACHW